MHEGSTVIRLWIARSLIATWLVSIMALDARWLLGIGLTIGASLGDFVRARLY
jgi:hypothetical protein